MPSGGWWRLVRVDLQVEMVLDDDVVSDDHERYHSAKSTLNDPSPGRVL